MRKLRERTRRNLDQGIDYLKMKVVSVCVIEAIARLTGGDVQIEHFMGHVDGGRGSGARLEHHLPLLSSPADDSHHDSPVHRLLVGGRNPGGFDMESSPLALFMYERLGEGGLLALYPRADEMLTDRCSPEDYLRQVPPEVLVPIANACKCTARTRSEAIEEIMASIVAP